MTSEELLRRKARSSASGEVVRLCGDILLRGTEEGWSFDRHNLSCFGVLCSTGDVSWTDMAFKALDAALTDSAEGRAYERSSEFRTLLSVSVDVEGNSRGVTSLRVWTSHWVAAGEGLRGCSGGVANGSVEDEGSEITWEVLENRSRELIALQAKVAALLAPGPSGFDNFRLDLGVFSPDFPDLKVVRMVYFSGLGDRIACSFVETVPGGNTGPINGDVLEGLWPRPTAAWSDDVFVAMEGRLGSAGRESSGYLIAGTVPWPIQPRSSVDTCDGSGEVDSGGAALEFWVVMAASCRDIRNASSRSMRSLHWSSS